MPIRVLLFAKIKRGDEAAFEAAFAQVSAKIRSGGTPGFVSDELLRDCTRGDTMSDAAPVLNTDDDTTLYVLVSEWESREAFFRWERAPIHKQTSTPMRPYWSGRVERKFFDIPVRL